MSQLILDLKQDHARLLVALAEVTDVGIGTPEGRRKLAELRTALLAHLALEDERLYPALRARARSDRKLAWTLQTFARDLDTVTAAVADFFGRSDTADVAELARAYGLLMARLKERIRKEEHLLFQAFLDTVAA